MSNVTLIIGESGTGKSTSLRNLNPAETFIINAIDKPLPFKNYKKKYERFSADTPTGNYYATDDYSRINRLIHKIDKERPEIKNIVLDDFQYIMANEYLRRATETGFTKFTEIAQHAASIIYNLMNCRADLYGFVLSHSSNDESGKSKCKTIGKLLDEKITIEGLFTIVLHSALVDNHYKFLTQSFDNKIAKSPMDMFDEIYIDNDLAYVKEKMLNYETSQ